MTGIAFVNVAQSVQIERGPYLQNVTSSSVVIKYRTDLSEATSVRYQPAAGGFAYSLTTPAGINHELTISALTPETEYIYEILDATGATLVAGPLLTFKTAPIPGTDGVYRFWAIGDAGTANSLASAVYEAYVDESAGRHTDVWLMLGDNAYTTGTDAQYQAAVFDMYTDLLPNTGFWSTRGNHEKDAGVYYSTHAHPTTGEGGGTPSGTEAYYSFDYGNVHFVCLDSYETDRSVGGAMFTWLEADLAATTAEFIVAYFHHPPYTKGSHDSDNYADSAGRMHEMRERALPLLEAYGCDLVLSGHSHSYERSFYINGHYGESDTFDPEHHLVNGGDGDTDGNGEYSTLNGTGTVYITAGNSGKVTGTLTRHNAMYASLYELGSVMIDVSNQVMQVRMLDAQARVRDDFTIRHDVAELPVIEDDGVSLVLPNDSRIEFDLTDLGGSDTEVFMYWGLFEEGKQLDAWNNVLSLGTYTSPQADTVTLTGLADNTTFYYRFFAQNSDGGSYSLASGSWTTDSSILPEVEFVNTAVNTTEVFVAKGEVWAFDDDNSVDTNWRTISFNDNAWAVGPAQLGYGDGDEDTVVSYGNDSGFKHITTWFRHTFYEFDPQEVTALTFNLLRDDGAVVYLNGIEVIRSNMPTGTITPSTTSSGGVGGANESTYFTYTVDPGVLASGKNVIAVEVHQRSITSSDISFDLEVVAEVNRPGAIGEIANITAAGGDGLADLLSTGGSATDINVYYGTTFGGDSPTSWDNSMSIPGTIGINPFQLTGLQPGTTYYVRVNASNANGSHWSFHTTSFTTLPYTVDTDSDGLPDGWEFEHFPDLTVSDGSQDSDGDGMNDATEYIAGTDPNDPASRLVLALDTDLVGATHYLYWTNTPGLMVDIQQCPDLNDPGGWQPLVYDVENGIYTNTIVPGDRIFYRLTLD